MVRKVHDSAHMTCSADDMRAYRINTRLSDPVIIIIFISIYYFFPVRFPFPLVSQNTIFPRRPTSGTGGFFFFLSVFRIKFACPPVVNIAFAARRHLLHLPHLPARSSSDCPPACHPVPRAIAFSHFVPRAITKLLIKIHRARNYARHTTVI